MNTADARTDALPSVATTSRPNPTSDGSRRDDVDGMLQVGQNSLEKAAADTSNLRPSTSTSFSTGIGRFSEVAKRSLVETLGGPEIRRGSSHRHASRRIPNFFAEEMWEGVVIEVFAEYFGARLSSFLREEPDQYAEILLKEVSREDLALVAEGALFTWSVGYLDGASGQRVGMSLLRLRRLPPVAPPADEDSWIAKVEATWIQD